MQTPPVHHVDTEYRTLQNLQNDLDLDLFCREVIHADFEHLKQTPCRNVFLGSHHVGDEVILDETVVEDRLVRKGRVEEVFGVSFVCFGDSLALTISVQALCTVIRRIPNEISDVF